MAPDGALSYHALTVGFYARAIKLLGRGASPAARALLDRLTRASWALAGPDGDISYFGRSQEQAWSLAITAYGADVAADYAGHGWATRYRALAHRALERLRVLHTGGPDGLYLTPAFREDRAAAIAAQEDYVSGSAYTGFTLLGLAWVGERVGPPGAIGSLGGSTRSTRRLDRGRRQFAVRSTGRVWLAARRRGSTLALMALKVRDRGGAWRDLVLHGATARRLAAARLSPRLSARADISPTACGIRIAAPGERRALEPHGLPPDPAAAAAHRQALRARPARAGPLPGSGSHRARRALSLALSRPGRAGPVLRSRARGVQPRPARLRITHFFTPPQRLVHSRARARPQAPRRCPRSGFCSAA